MNNRKIHFGFGAREIVALVFGIIGAVYTPMGLAFIRIPQIPIVLPLVFGGIGIVFLGVSLILILTILRRRAGIRDAISDGHYVTATISDVYRDQSIRVNGRSPYRAECTVTESSGRILLYKSHTVKYCPSTLIGQSVRVYVNRNNEKYYYVDIDSLLPEIKEV